MVYTRHFTCDIAWYIPMVVYTVYVIYHVIYHVHIVVIVAVTPRMRPVCTSVYYSHHRRGLPSGIEPDFMCVRPT